MDDDADPIPEAEAEAALRATDVAATPISDELDRWQIGDFHLSDADLRRPAASRGLVEDSDSR